MMTLEDNSNNYNRNLISIKVRLISKLVVRLNYRVIWRHGY